MRTVMFHRKGARSALPQAAVTVSPSTADIHHYRLKGFGQTFHLELQPTKTLLSPGFTVHVLGTPGSNKAYQSFRPSSERICHYQGRLRGHDHSSVALSTCDGLSGLIRTQSEEYLLSPLPSYWTLPLNVSKTRSPIRPHMLYKRSAEQLLQRQPSDISQPRIRGFMPNSSPHAPASSADTFSPREHPRHFCNAAREFDSGPQSWASPALPDEYPLVHRGRRAAGPADRERLAVETLVVADRRLLEKHAGENITMYLLTVLNMVSALFKDGTIGKKIDIVVVGIVLLEEDQPGLSISHHADHTLNSFCQWQAGLVRHGAARHDHAILLTGFDICAWQNRPCDTLGFAPISGMCSKYRSCTINEDSGLGVAYTIAHESGHNFGMVHDGEGNLCKKAEGNIMSPTLSGNNGLFSWSDCSRQYLHRFLSTPQAACLADEPRIPAGLRFPARLPGQLYDPSTQCRWQFGSKASVCTHSFSKNVCKALWCRKAGGHCETKFMPAAEGTKCGRNMVRLSNN
uniref:Peptidase M12B domain-containing protein n=1 Tax=Eptatretus burgeri TaxID=7764 RepID=A0A8C4QKM8_EPTBU